MAGWGAALKGQDCDLADWSSALRETHDPHVVRLEGILVLRSATFDMVSDERELQIRAIPLIDRLNGLVFCEKQSGRVDFEGAVEFSVSGPRKHCSIELRGVSARATAGDFSLGTNSKAWVQEANQKLNSLDSRIAIAVEQYGKSRGDWINIYKTIEVIKEYYGGEENYKKKFGPRAGALKQTANHYRHMKAPLPPIPASLDEAHDLLGSYVKKMLAEAS